VTEPHRFPIIEPDATATVQLTLAERFGILHNIFKYQYFAVYRVIGERFGWDVANEIAGDVASEASPMLAEAYRKKFSLPGEGAALMSQVMQAEFQGEGSDAAVTEESVDAAQIEILCGFGAALQKPRFAEIPITDGLCERGCRQWAKDIAATIDPELQVERLTWMGDGAPRCRYRIERQPASAS
jgi:hypothetical protein